MKTALPVTSNGGHSEEALADMGHTAVSPIRGDRALTRWVAGVGLGVVALCVIAALSACLFSLFMIGSSATRQPLAKSAVPLISGAKANEQAAYLQVANYEAHVAMLAGRQVLLLVGIFAGLCLIGAGFCLFAIGAQGAFELNADRVDVGRTLIRATAPGLLCFVLAAAVVMTSMIAEYNLVLGRFALDSDPAVTKAQADLKAKQTELDSPLPNASPMNTRKLKQS